MSFITVTGVLTNPSGAVLPNYNILFEAIRTSDTVINNTDVLIVTNSSGGYSFELGYGTYTLKIKSGREARYSTVASNIMVYSQTLDNNNIQQILLAQADIEDVNEDLITQLFQIKSEILRAEASTLAARDTAVTKAAVAATSATNAASSATSAATSASTATTKATEAATSATSATASASTATTKATEAATSASNAATSKLNAATSASNAAASAAAAYSSEQKVANYASTLVGGIVENGNADLSSGIPPTPISSSGTYVSTLWKVTVGGTINGGTYAVGDSIVYSKSLDSYYKIDSTDQVTSVNGQTGTVNITTISGNASSSSKWATARNIVLTASSDISGTIVLDGSADVTWTATLDNTGVSAGTYGTATTVTPLTVDAKGRVTAAGTALTITPAYTSVTNIPVALTSIGSLTPVADRFPYYTSGTVATLGTITSFARTILDDADAATVKTTLGISTLAQSILAQTGYTNINSTQRSVQYFNAPPANVSGDWIKIVEAVTALGVSSNDFTAIVSGLEDLGAPYGSTAIIRFGTRGGTNLNVYRMFGVSNDGSRFGYVVNATSGNTEVWLRRDGYTNNTRITILNSSGMRVPDVATYTPSATEPAGIVYVSDSTWSFGSNGIAVRDASSDIISRFTIDSIDHVTRIKLGSDSGGFAIQNSAGSDLLDLSTAGTLVLAGGVSAAGSFASFRENAALELGSTTAANTPYIDLRSSGNAIDYDVRIIASGGTTSSGNGALTINAAGGITLGGPVTNNYSSTRTFAGTSNRTVDSITANGANYLLDAVGAAGSYTPSTVVGDYVIRNTGNGTNNLGLHLAGKRIILEVADTGSNFGASAFAAIDTDGFYVGGTNSNIASQNPDNISANISISWLSNIPRLKIAGTGTGTANGFQIQKPGDIPILIIDNNGTLKPQAGIVAPAHTSTTVPNAPISGIMATNDVWGIRVGATATDSGYLEFMTGDNGNEPIYVKQYTGATATRTLTLLDASGDTYFPGNIHTYGVGAGDMGIKVGSTAWKAGLAVSATTNEYLFGGCSSGGDTLTSYVRIGPSVLTYSPDASTQYAIHNQSNLPYEEGTFTPTVSGSTTAGTATYTQAIGRYSRIGNKVYISININFSSLTGTGPLQVGGLPFISTSNYYHPMQCYHENITFTGAQLTAQLGVASSTLRLLQVSSGSFTTFNCVAAGILRISGFYGI